MIKFLKLLTDTVRFEYHSLICNYCLFRANRSRFFLPCWMFKMQYHLNLMKEITQEEKTQ